MNPPFWRRAMLVALTLGVVAGCAGERAEAPAPPLGASTVPAAPIVDGVVPTTAVGPAIRSMVMIGDSITLGSETALRDGLSALGVEIRAIDAEDSRRMTSDGIVESGVEAIVDVSNDGAPDLWVIALGTNDVGQYDGAENYAPVIAELLAAVPPGAPLVWVDVYLESIPDASAEFNETLRDALGARGQATVVDWASLAEEDGVLRDGIHPSGYGIDQFARLVTDAVGQWMG